MWGVEVAEKVAVERQDMTQRMPNVRAVEWHPLAHILLASAQGLSASAPQAAEAQQVKEGAIIFVRDAAQVQILKSAHVEASCR